MKRHHIWKLQPLIKVMLDYVLKKTHELSHGSLTVDEFYMSTSDFSITEDVAKCCKNIQQAIQSKIFWNIVSNFFHNASEKQVPFAVEKQVPVEDGKQVLDKDEKQVPITNADAYDEISLPVLFGHEILQTLEYSTSLLDFLREVIDEDIRNLIDAVEEHSEQYVRESTVSDLIEIKRFFQPILKGDFQIDISGLFEKLQNQITNTGIQNVAEKIVVCRDNLHSLIALYKNVANRGERTVEVIDNIVNNGIILFSLHQKNCIVSVKYEQNGKKHKHSNADLSDLRSRALLLMNAEEKDRTKKSTRKEQLQVFVNLVDQSFEIAHLCMRLKESGHFLFSSYDKICKKDDMLSLIERLQNQFDSWMSEINDCRNRHYYMNFLYSNQLYELYRYLHGDAKTKI
ncbi:RNF213 [Mytilus edulis]|uniref:RNF213 n=1 Tax=Mytilus edulis TaxID=6550 RepID=A0A8S3TUM4_MYTED|nr:RNF213 [Mytilus edulis]